MGKIGRSNSDRQSKIDTEDIDMAQFEYPERNAGGNKRTGNMKYIKAHHAHRRRDGMRSSAMSDTSEAPSLASHVRRVRVPSQASDVDQFLDDLFMPVLDGNIDDGLSDARSLAASMRGGSDDVTKEANDALEFQRTGSIRRKSVLPRVIEKESDTEDVDEELSNLTIVSKLVSIIQGGGSPNPSQGAASPKKTSDFTPITSSAMGFHPIPGVISPHPISGMISPPLIMPTPIQGHQMFSMGSSAGNGVQSPPLLMQAGGDSNSNQPAMAFTYVPVPVYNLGGLGMSMMPGKNILS